jgi:hypothetical protein
MKNIIYFVGLVVVLSFIFKTILFAGGLTLTSVFIAAFFTVVSLFVIDKLSHRRSR